MSINKQMLSFTVGGREIVITRRGKLFSVDDGCFCVGNISRVSESVGGDGWNLLFWKRQKFLFSVRLVDKVNRLRVLEFINEQSS